MVEAIIELSNTVLKHDDNQDKLTPQYKYKTQIKQLASNVSRLARDN